MAWTAKVANVHKQANLIEVLVQYYKDDALIVGKTYRLESSPPAEWLEQKAKREIEILSGIDETTITLGPVAEPTPDTPPDQGMKAFRRTLEKARAVKDLIDFKVITATDPKVQTLVTELQAALATYWDML